MLLSVVIPCYNDGAFLVEALDSVAAQQGDDDVTLPDIEVVVVDDRSHDPDTLAILEAAPRRWPNVRVVKNQRKQGVSGARNFGIAACRGDWVALLDADDIWLPDALRERWRVLLTEPSATWIAGDWLYWYPDRPIATRFETGRSNSAEILSDAFETGKPVKLVRPVKEFIRACLILPSAVMVKTDVLNKVGDFDESLSPAEDYDMWLRLAMVADLHFVPKSVFHYRQRPGSLSNKGGAPATMDIRMFSSILADPGFKPFRREIREKLALLSLANAYHYRQTQAWGLAFKSALEVVRWKPLSLLGWKQLAAALVSGFARPQR